MSALVLQIPHALTAAPLPTWCLNSSSQPLRDFGAQRPLLPDFVDPSTEANIILVRRFRTRVPGFLARGMRSLASVLSKPFQASQYDSELSQLIESAQHNELVCDNAIQSAYRYLKRNEAERATSALRQAEASAQSEAAIWRQAGIILNAAKAMSSFSYNAWRLGVAKLASSGVQLSLQSYLCWPPHKPDLQQKGSYASLLELSTDLVLLIHGPDNALADNYHQAHTNFTAMNDGSSIYKGARTLIEAAKTRTANKRDLLRGIAG